MRNTPALLLSISLTALMNPMVANAENPRQPQPERDCSNLLANTPALKKNDFLGTIPTPFWEPLRDTQYESTQAFAERVKVAKAQHAMEISKKMEGKNLLFKITTGEYLISYNPDRGGFSAASEVNFRSRKDSKQVPYPALISPTPEDPRTRKIGLGAKSVTSNYYGLAFVKSSVKHPFASGVQRDFFFKYPVEKAKDLGKNVRLAYVGVLQAPWSFNSHSSWTDFETRTDHSLHTSYAAVNLICAAVVDQRNNKILYEFR